MKTNNNIFANAAGRLAELLTSKKANQKDTDVVMSNGTKEIIGGKKNDGHLVALYKGRSNLTFGEKFFNALRGKTVATYDEVHQTLMTSGMSKEQATTALDKITIIGKGYSAKEVNAAINKFHFETTTSTVKILLPDNLQSNSIKIPD